MPSLKQENVSSDIESHGSVSCRRKVHSKGLFLNMRNREFRTIPTCIIAFQFRLLYRVLSWQLHYFHHYWHWRHHVQCTIARQ